MTSLVSSQGSLSCHGPLQAPCSSRSFRPSEAVCLLWQGYMARTSSLAACDQRFVEGCSTGRLLVGVCVAEKHGQHSGAQELVPAPSSISPRQVRPSVYDSGATYIGQALHVRLWQCDAGRSTLASRLAGQNGQAGKGMHLDRQQQFPAVLQQPCSSSHSNLHFQAARHGIAETPGGCIRAIAASRHCLRDPAQAFGFFFQLGRVLHHTCF